MRRFWLIAFLFLAPTLVGAQDIPKYSPPEQVKAAFKKLLDRPKVAFDVRATKSGPGVPVETLTFASEKKADGQVERVPTQIRVPANAKGKLPAVIVLHGTGGSGNAANVQSFIADLNKRNIIGIAIDARYHGDRAKGAKGPAAYNEAILKAWKTKPGEPMEHPFYYDTVWDL